MKNNRAYTVVLAATPMVAGVFIWLLEIPTSYLLPHVGRMGEIVVRLCIVLLITYAAERIALNAILRATGVEGSELYPSLKKLRIPLSRESAPELQQALYRASAYPVTIACLLGYVTGPSVGPDGVSNMAFFGAAIFGIGLVAAYAIMLTGWRRCKELLDTKP